MKGQLVGNGEALLWPDQVVMVSLRAISRPRNELVSANTDALDLLWPAKLINEQARRKQHRDVSQPITLVTFVLSAILAAIIGPVQLFLIAMTSDYNWVTTVYFPEALRYVIIAGGVIALVNLVALALAWRSQPKRTRMTIMLSVSSIILFWLIWLSGQMTSWQPHHITVILIGTVIACIVALLLLSKQYIEELYNDVMTKVVLSLLMVSSLFCGVGGVLYYQASANIDPVKLSQISANQAAARIEGVPEMLSDALFTLCNGKYQVVYLGTSSDNGVFECSKDGDVYSAAELPSSNNRTVSAAATYLGTTNDVAISRAFPNSYYLYRQMPQVLEENELVLMLPATSEQELIDNLAPLLLVYWENNNQQNLFLNVFYNKDFGAIASTRDYILMTALGTMTLTDKLPNGNNISGYYNGKKVNYQYVTDRELTALNELGADPTLYANGTRDALKTHRHISLHLEAGQVLEPGQIRAMLQEALTGGM